MVKIGDYGIFNPFIFEDDIDWDDYKPYIGQKVKVIGFPFAGTMSFQVMAEDGKTLTVHLGELE